MSTAQQKIYFPGTGKSYTLNDLLSMDKDQLLELRNLVADNLGSKPLTSFSTLEKAVRTTWHVLNVYQEKKGKEQKSDVVSKAPVERPLAKATKDGFVKRPKREDFAVIRIPDPKVVPTIRAVRWKNYHDGMMLVEVKEKDGCIMWDVKQWVKEGVITIEHPTDTEYEVRRAEWFAKRGWDDPHKVKERELEEKKARQQKAKENQGVKTG